MKSQRPILALEPTLLWQMFDELNQIPRPSNHEEAAILRIEAICDERGFEHFRDKTGNLMIKKPATVGYENRKTVVMQGHIDMVPQKNADSDHDFAKDPIKTIIDGQWLRADGTTLGADNGIGVAAALAVFLDDDIEHGPLEILITIDEEAGMTGALGLEAGLLDADILLNLDTEDEGELYVGCAGGADISATANMQFEPIPTGFIGFEILISGLKGGHSGLDIDLGRANANKLVNDFILKHQESLGLLVNSFNGGTLRNAIPRESFTKVAVKKDKQAEFLDAIAAFEISARIKFDQVEDQLSITANKIGVPHKAYTKESLRLLLESIEQCLSGVQTMSDEFEGVVESSNNLAVVKTNEDTVEILCLCRSLSNELRDKIAQSISTLFQDSGLAVNISGAYPGWKPVAKSEILTQMQLGYKNQFGEPAKVKVIHAGLECGLLGEVYPNWDMISLGPTIRNAHSPDEKVHIKSVEKFWALLLETLKNIPQK